MCTIAIEAVTPLYRTSRINLYKNIARSRLFCRIAKRSIIYSRTYICCICGFCIKLDACREIGTSLATLSASKSHLHQTTTVFKATLTLLSSVIIPLLECRIIVLPTHHYLKHFPTSIFIPIFLLPDCSKPPIYFHIEPFSPLP